MKTIFTNLAPNYERDDVLLASKLIFLPWLWKTGQATEKLEKKIADCQGVKNSYLFSSGRSALFAILKCLNLENESEILLQAYTCVAVPDPILWNKLKPIWVDCDETLTMSPADLEKKITPKSKVLIIQHTFGASADLEKLVSIAKKHNLFVIEDCAHALGADYKGQKLGTFGDAAFFSFGRDKVISSVFGGAVIVKDDQLAKEISSLRADFALPSACWVLQQLMHPIVIAKSKFFYNCLSFGKVILAVSKKLNIISKSVYSQEKQGGKPIFYNQKMPNALALLALNQFEKIERFNTHRRKIAAIYDQALGNALRKQRVIGDGDIYLRYTVFTEKAAILRAEGKKQGILLGDWYDCPIAPRGVNLHKVNFTSDNCPVSLKLSSQSLNLPTGIAISEDDARRIAKFVLQNL